MYCRTSLPPVFSMTTPLMVLGMDAMVRTNWGVLEKCEDIVPALPAGIEVVICREASLKDMYRATGVFLGQEPPQSIDKISYHGCNRLVFVEYLLEKHGASQQRAQVRFPTTR